MLTIDEKREACVQYEADWLEQGACRSDIEWIIRDGFRGWVNLSDQEVERFYKECIEEEKRAIA